MNTELKERLESIIGSDRVVVFMKGTREQPQCGFSATVVGILNDLVPNYTTVNVLADYEVREGIKEYASWPTIPQIYVEKEFIGGCDILRELSRSGEIFEALKIPKPEVVVPKVDITPAAIDAFKVALEDADDGDYIRLKMNPDMSPELSFGPRGANDVEILQDGVMLLVDMMSASRVNGMTIDFKTGPMGSGFEIFRAKVKSMTVQELKEKMAKGEPYILFDVRTREEWDEGKIPTARLMLDVPAAEIDALDKNATLIFQCRSGGRSQKAAENFATKGFQNVYNLTGGIRAWNEQ